MTGLTSAGTGVAGGAMVKARRKARQCFPQRPTIGRSAPPANARQWKETVNVPAWGSAKILVKFVKFVDFTGTYVFHCHILEHEDKGLMGQFRVS